MVAKEYMVFAFHFLFLYLYDLVSPSLEVVLYFVELNGVMKLLDDRGLDFRCWMHGVGCVLFSCASTTVLGVFSGVDVAFVIFSKLSSNFVRAATCLPPIFLKGLFEARLLSACINFFVAIVAFSVDD